MTTTVAQKLDARETLETLRGEFGTRGKFQEYGDLSRAIRLLDREINRAPPRPVDARERGHAERVRARILRRSTIAPPRPRR